MNDREPMVIELFAGPGGASTGIRLAGHHGPMVGIEWDHDACVTATRAGHARIETDVAAYPPSAFADVDVDGLWASPPCVSFSLAGKQKGLDVEEAFLTHVYACRDGWVDPPDAICVDDIRADLTLQPLRWTCELRPRWVVCEQVPGVRHIWAAMADVLRGWGYSAWSGRLDSERFGVPQTRTRAFLIARRDGQDAVPPTPTHTAYDPRAPDKGRTPEPSLFGDGLEPYVTMAEALRWPQGQVLRTGQLSYKHGRTPEDLVEYVRDVEYPAPTVSGQVGAYWSVADEDAPRREDLRRGPSQEDGKRETPSDDGEDWQLATMMNRRMNEGEHRKRPEGVKREPDEPSPTIDTTAGNWRFVSAGQTGEGRPRDPDESPAATLTGKGYWLADGSEWAQNRPATTVIGADQVAAPGHRCMSDDCCGKGPRRHFDGEPVDWTGERPATTVMGDRRVQPPGHKVNSGDVERLGEDEASERYDTRAGKRSIRVTVEQAAVLQGFQPGYPWYGSKTSQYRMVGNAVPPPMAAAIVRNLL